MIAISLLLMLLFGGSKLVLMKTALPNCRGNEYIDGKWIFNESIPKSFICCGWDPGDYLDPKVCGPTTQPKFYNTTSIRGSNLYYSQPGGHGCGCDTIEGVFSVQKREKYYWAPKNCSLPTWSAKKFCRLLQDKTILLVGDSTNRQTATTLMSMITAGKGNCSHQIYSARSDSLVSKANGSKTLIEVFESYVKRDRFTPSILIMTTGAHFRAIADFQRNWDGIYPQIKYLHQKFPHTKIFWKTQNPGHVYCLKDKAPILKYQKRTQRKDAFQWNLHRDYDLISYDMVNNLTQLFQQSDGDPNNKPFIEVLDFYPLYLRPDSHPSMVKADCLHYCIPGPLNLIGNILLNKLITKEM